MTDQQIEANNFRKWMYFWIFIGSFVIFYVIYNFYFEKNYSLLVEESCDPNSQVCFYRSCDEEECPPNELEYFSQYRVAASDFEACNKGSCDVSTLCTLNQSLCTKIDCISGIDQCSNTE